MHYMIDAETSQTEMSILRTMETTTGTVTIPTTETKTLPTTGITIPTTAETIETIHSILLPTTTNLATVVAV